mgnify:CR=1 FL=1
MAARIVVAQPIDDDIVAELEVAGRVHVHRDLEPLSYQALGAVCSEAEGLMAFMTERVDAALLHRCPRLRVVAGALKGSDNIDLAACAARDVTVTICPNLLTEPTAELALGLAIALGRNFRAGEADVRSGTFSGWRPRHYGASLNGATVGVLGAGAVGQALLRMLGGFSCTRLYHDPVCVPPAALGARPVGIEELRAQSDFLFLATPLTSGTLRLVDAAFLGAMKPGAYLVNPARGSVVDEEAIADALETGRLAGYAADVFACEDIARPDRSPRVPARLLRAPNTVLTPHLGSAVVDVRRRIAGSAAESILAVLDGRRPATAIAGPWADEAGGC